MKEYKLTINGKTYRVGVSDIKNNRAQVTVNGTGYQAEIVSAETSAAEGAAVAVAGVGAAAAVQNVSPGAPSVPAAVPAQTAQAGQATQEARPAAKGCVVRAPLPGIILSVNVSKGQTVKRGDKVAVIEAMKMENEILAEADGTVSEIHVAQGDSVLDEAKIITIA